MTASNSHFIADQAHRPSTARGKFASTIIMLLLTELLLPLLFPPFYCFFLAPVALVPFVICILRRPMNWLYLLLYYAVGVLFFVINLYWLAPVTFGGVVALSFFVGLYFPLFAFGTNRLVLQLRLPATIAVPVVWTAVEFMRASFIQGGFPWFLLGQCLAPVSLFIQAADIFGVWGLTFVIALLNGFVVDLLRLPLRQPGEARFNPAILRLGGTAALLLVGVISYGIFRLQERTTTPGPLVCVIQENIPQEVKDSPDSSQQVWIKHLELTLMALNKEPNLDLLVWPETMVPGLCNAEYLKAPASELRTLGGDPSYWLDVQSQSREYMQFLTDVSTKRNVPMLLGIGALVPRGTYSNSVKQNRTVLVLPGRGIVDDYAKIHLVPFGEYVPFREAKWLNAWLLSMTPYGVDYSNEPGRRWTRFILEHESLSATTLPGSSARENVPAGTIKRWSFGTPICFEDTMPYPAREMVNPNSAEAKMNDGGRKADFLVNVSNEGWFKSVELDQHLQASILRAVENRVPMARSVNTGNSGFIDSCGRVTELVRGPDGKSLHAIGIAIHRMEIDSRLSLYTRIGDLFPIVCGIVATLAVAWTLVRPRKGRLR